LAEGERLGFVFPVYSWAPPKLVLDFVKKLTVKVPEPAYIYFACTCGDNCGLTEKVFRKAVEEKGLSLSACFSVQMPETYIGMAGFKLDTPENAKLKIDKADSLLMRNIPRLINKESFSEMVVGGLAWLKTYLVNPGFNRSATDDSKYLSTEACIHCGKCVEACPTGDVRLNADKRPEWQHDGTCTCCLACYHHCPKHAINYGSITRKRGQYYFRGEN
jgi:NAD-dependent dihydropyrimidine dehydrogenase PreA subunit